MAEITIDRATRIAEAQAAYLDTVAFEGSPSVAARHVEAIRALILLIPERSSHGGRGEEVAFGKNLEALQSEMDRARRVSVSGRRYTHLDLHGFRR